MKANLYPVLVGTLVAAISLVGCLGDSDGKAPARNDSGIFEVSFGHGGAGKPALRNVADDPAHTVELGINVASGQTIEIWPKSFVIERMDIPEPQITRENNNVCVESRTVCDQTEPTFERRCEERCRLCMRCSVFPPGCYPWRCCDNQCWDQPTGSRCVRSHNECVRSENQWKETAVYSAPSNVRQEIDELPMAKASLLLEGLKLRFHESSLGTNGDVLVCPLKLFAPVEHADHFTVQLRNVEGCDSIFLDDNSRSMSVALINDMKAPVPYRLGTQVTAWTGEVLQAAAEQIFDPVIDLVGALRVLPIAR